MEPALRLGLISDLHHEPDPARRRSWINPYDPAGLLERVEAALRWFVEEEVDLVVVAGDAVESASERALDEILAALTAAGRPVGLVGGNHDWDPSGLAQAKAREHGVTLLDAAPAAGSVDVVGVAAVPVRPPALPFAAADAPRGDRPRVVVSHFPLLGESERLVGAGLPYPGDLTNRRELAASLQAEPVRVLVLSGHIHARCSRVDGPILQLSCGALIEPPHDAAIVSVAAELRWVERRVRRLGPVAAVDPVFAPELERWESGPEDCKAFWSPSPPGSRTVCACRSSR